MLFMFFSKKKPIFAHMFEEVVTSTHNPGIKRLIAIQNKSSERRKSGLFVVEGVRELLHCVEAGFVVDTLYILPEVVSDSIWDFMPRDSVRVVKVSKDVYAKIAYRDSTEGVVALVRNRQLFLNDLHLGEAPLLIVLERVEKPGNLGAVLRSADAAAADAVIICDPLTDIFNPNIIRSSIGAVFSVPCVACSSADCVAFLKDNKIRILTAQLQDSCLYYQSDMCGPTAIVMGTEATGLTDVWRTAADEHIRIPMLGKLDSLNVSVSAAILLFEAVRQRNLHTAE